MLIRALLNVLGGLFCIVAITGASALNAPNPQIETISNASVGTCSIHGCAAAFFLAERLKPEILIFDSRAQVIGKIPAPVKSALSTDSAGRLYVSGNYQRDYIEVYSPPSYGNPSKIGVPTGQEANGVAVDARSGILAVFSGVPRGAGAEVSFYRPGSTRPCATVHSTAIGAFVGGEAAFDRNGTLFAFVFTQNGVALTAIPGACSANTIQRLTFTKAYHFLGYYEFDSNDNFIIQTYAHGANGSTIYTFSHPNNGKFADPIIATDLDKYNGLGEYFVCLLRDGKHLWGTSYRNISLYNYPAGGAPLITLTGSTVGDGYIAIVPPLQP